MLHRGPNWAVNESNAAMGLWGSGKPPSVLDFAGRDETQQRGRIFRSAKTETCFKGVHGVCVIRDPIPPRARMDVFDFWPPSVFSTPGRFLGKTWARYPRNKAKSGAGIMFPFVLAKTPRSSRKYCNTGATAQEREQAQRWVHGCG